MEERIGAFVDWQNLQGSVNRLHPDKRIDVKKLRSYIGTLGKVVYQGIYIADFSQLNLDKEEQKRYSKFVQLIERSGFDVVKRSATRVHKKNGPPEDAVKADCDVEIAVNAAILATSGKIDRLILFSGDRDFAYLIKRIRKIPFCVSSTVICSIEDSTNAFRSASSEVVFLEKVIDQFVVETFSLPDLLEST